MLVLVHAGMGCGCVGRQAAGGGGERAATVTMFNFLGWQEIRAAWYKTRVPTRGYVSQSVVFQSVHIAVFLD